MIPLLIASATALTLSFTASAHDESAPPSLGIDANNNRISDLYEAMHPGLAAGHADNDSDGISNEDESAAGTNPFNGTDSLNFTSVTNSGVTVDAAFRSVDGKLYQLQASTTTNAAWTNDGNPMQGDGTTLNMTSPATGGRMFLRLQVSDQDSDSDGVSDWEEIQAGTNRYMFDTDGDGFSDLSYVQGLLGTASTVNIHAAQAAAPEGGSATFRVTRHGGFLPLSIPLSTAGSTATASDYNLFPQTTLVLPAGSTSALITMTALTDALPGETAETVQVTLGAGAGYTLGASTTATVTIVTPGITGEYFNASTGTLVTLPATDANFTGVPALSRKDAAIDFDWLGVAPPPLVNDDAWVARWQGFVIPKYSELYQIHAIADRGVLVYFSGAPITGAAGQIRITQVTTTNPTTKYSANALTGNVPLVAGNLYHLRVDYRDSSTNPNNSNIQIRWSSPSQVEEVIPTGALTSDNVGGAAPVITSPLFTTAVSGAPFNYQITATNSPTTFTASGLPAGLSVNAAGLISGTLAAAAGYHFTTITAGHAGGTDSRLLVIYVATTGGGITREVWTGLNGSGVLSVPVHTAPSSTSNVSSLAAPENAGDDFGDRMRGYITAPTSGLYTFFVTSDENAEVWISASEEPARKLKRSFITAGSVGTGVWNALPSQQSLSMRLNGGRRYYVEVIRRESSGTDHLQVGWLKPGQTGLPEVIPGWALSPYTPPPATSENGFLYSAVLTPQSGAASLGTGSALLRVNEDKTEADLTVTWSNLTGPVNNSHLHDSRDIPGPTGAIIFDIDDADPDRLLPGGDGLDPSEVYRWDIIGTGQHTYADVVAAIEGGTAYINLHTAAYPMGEIRGFFAPVIGSQFFTPPPAPPPAELTLPSDPTARSIEIVRFLQQATFGAHHDTDGSAPWDPDSIEAVDFLGYTAWVDAQLAMSPGADPETMVQVQVPPRIYYRYTAPTTTTRTFRLNGLANTYNGSGPMATWLRGYAEDWPISSYGTVGAPLEDSNEIWRTWWRISTTAQDQLRWRVAFALSQIMVVSEDGELDEQARAMVHYNDLLYYHGLGNFRTLLEKVTLNPAMGRYLDMLNNRKPNPATGYIPNENFAREILQLFTIGLRRLHPDGTLVLDSGGLPVATYDQPNVVGFSHVFTGWIQPGSGSNYVAPMIPRASDHDTGEKLLLDQAVIPMTATATTASTIAELTAALDIIHHHPNTGPFICRQLIQRMVTANPSPGYIYRISRVFDDNGSGVRGDMTAVVRALLLDSEARNQAPRNQPGFGHLKEPVVRVTQMLRAFNGFSYGENNYGATNVIGTVAVSPNANVDLTQPLPFESYAMSGGNTLFAGDIIRLTGQTVTAQNGYYYFNGIGQPLTSGAPTTGSVGTFTINIDITTGPPATNFPVVEGIALQVNNLLLLRNQTNLAENGVYILTAGNAPLTRAPRADTAEELSNGVVTVAAYRDPVTLAYSTKTYKVDGVITALGTDPVNVIDGSATSSGRRMWEMGNTGSAGGSNLAQTPLRASTVFNFFEPDYVFLGYTGNAGLYSPEFQITSETSVVNTANWFHTLTSRNSGTALPHTWGQGYDYGSPIRREIKLDMTAQEAIAADAPALVDNVSAMLLPGQMTPRLRTLLTGYLNNLPQTGSTVLIASGATWKYFTDAAGLGASDVVEGHPSWSTANWKHLDFSDTGWNSGAAPLGYRTGTTPVNLNIATVIPYGGNNSNKWVSSYYRGEFSIAAAAAVPNFTVRLKRDDGAIVYVNGREAWRTNFNTGVVASGSTLANGSGDDGAAFFPATIPGTFLRDGRNVVAIEVHQNSISSSDVFFDLELSTPFTAPADRMNRVSELLSILSLTPEFATQK